MRVHLDVSGSYNDDDVTSEVVEMPAVPRIGDTLQLDDETIEYEIINVMWTPKEPGFDAYVALR